MNTIFTIAKLTYREALRRKIVVAALILGVAFLVLFGLGFYFIRQDFIERTVRGGFTPSPLVQQQAYNFMTQAGMYVVNFLGIAIAALISADSLAGEIQSGTIQAVVTKPIRRREVVLGKWLGHAALLALYLLFIGGGVVLLVRIVAGFGAPNWAAGLALVYFNGLIIMSLTMFFSSMLSTLATGGAVFGAYGLAFIGGWVERIGTSLHSPTAVNLGILSSLLLPSEAVWNKAAAAMSSPLLSLASGVNPFTSSSQPTTLMMAYAVAYLLLAVILAVWQFGKRDL